MGSDAKAPSARARRSLAAAAGARDGISAMVEALRVSKPPRAPDGDVAARRYALIPLAEGRVELEARIRALEDVVAAKDAEVVRLKRAWGRALVRRKALEKEREGLKGVIAMWKERAVAGRAGVAAARRLLVGLVEDVVEPVGAVREALKRESDGLREAFVDDVEAALDDVEDALDAAGARAAEAAKAATDNAREWDVPEGKASFGISPVKGPKRTGSYVGSDDDRSCISFASSTVFGDDREAQIDALVDLVDILEAKVASAPPVARPRVDAAILRAHRSTARARPNSRDVVAAVAQRDSLRAQLDAVMAEKETVGGEDAALALAAKAQAELRETTAEMQVLRERLARVENIAARSARQGELGARNQALEEELRSAKKTVGRLVQERNTLRRTTGAVARKSLLGTPTAPSRAASNSDAMRRVLDWRQRASSESGAVPAAIGTTLPPTMPSTPTTGNAMGGAPASNPSAAANSTFELPSAIRPTDSRNDGDVPPLLSRDTQQDMLPNRADRLGRSPSKKRRVEAGDTHGASGADVDNVAASASERSLELGDSVSVQSVPVMGFLRRHNSFTSAGGLSASEAGDEVTITAGRNIFTSSRTPRVDGLQGLLAGLQ